MSTAERPSRHPWHIPLRTGAAALLAASALVAHPAAGWAATYNQEG